MSYSVAEARRPGLPKRVSRPSGFMAGEGEADDDSDEKNDELRSGSFRAGRGLSVVGEGADRLCAGSRFVPTGATMTVTPVVSADRRYVRLGVNAFFNDLNIFRRSRSPAVPSAAETSAAEAAAESPPG